MFYSSFILDYFIIPAAYRQFNYGIEGIPYTYVREEAAALIYKSEDFTSSRITKTDSFNASYSRASSSSSNSKSVSEKLVLDYCHEVDLKLTDYTTLNASGSLNYDMTVNKINILTAALSIGATVRF